MCRVMAFRRLCTSLMLTWEGTATAPLWNGTRVMVSGGRFSMRTRPPGNTDTGLYSSQGNWRWEPATPPAGKRCTCTGSWAPRDSAIITSRVAPCLSLKIKRSSSTTERRPIARISRWVARPGARAKARMRLPGATRGNMKRPSTSLMHRFPSTETSAAEIPSPNKSVTRPFTTAVPPQEIESFASARLRRITSLSATKPPMVETCTTASPGQRSLAPKRPAASVSISRPLFVPC